LIFLGALKTDNSPQRLPIGFRQQPVNSKKLNFSYALAFSLILIQHPELQPMATSPASAMLTPGSAEIHRGNCSTAAISQARIKLAQNFPPLVAPLPAPSEEGHAAACEYRALAAALPAPVVDIDLGNGTRKRCVQRFATRRASPARARDHRARSAHSTNTQRNPHVGTNGDTHPRKINDLRINSSNMGV
jgi:hypothetical protein